MRELCRIVAGLRRPQQVDGFLRALLTPAERDRIAMRWRLVCLLEAGVRQRTIAEKLHVSLCKITRGSRELQHGPLCFRASVKKSVQRSQPVV
jgi:TrpR family trp operon transcriptional repressor